MSTTLNMPSTRFDSVKPFQAFIRDGYCCVYCGEHILTSYGSFAKAHLGYLKPESASGPREDVWNRVTSCGACNTLKGAFDPVQNGRVTEASFAAVVAETRNYIQRVRGIGK